MPYNYEFITRSNNQSVSLDDINEEIKQQFKEDNIPDHWACNMYETIVDLAISISANVKDNFSHQDVEEVFKRIPSNDPEFIDGKQKIVDFFKKYRFGCSWSASFRNRN
jgi:hypothetical protein